MCASDTVVQAPTPQQREMMEEAANRIAQDNCELACCFIQKTAVEKAGPEMDKRLATVRLELRFKLLLVYRFVFQTCNVTCAAALHARSL